jgi:hypothetical protein
VDPEWLLRLPATITELEFSFLQSQTIWVRKVRAEDTLHWSLTSNGYTPISMKDTFPQLRRLKLRGDWDQPYTWSSRPQPLVRGEFLARSDSAMPNYIPEGFVKWTGEMKWLFIKNLPAGLVSLELSSQGLPPCPIPLFPPQLERLIVSAHLPARQHPPYHLPETLFETLSDFHWFLDFNQETTRKFRHLQRLHLPMVLETAQVVLLPTTLTDLDIECPQNVESIALFPPLISKLLLHSCPGYPSGRSVTLDPSKHINYTNLFANLPRLTDLSLHSVTGKWTLETSLSKLGATLPLKSLSIKKNLNDHISYISCTTMHWIASPTLQTLEISELSAGFRDDSFRSWPSTIPCNITNILFEGPSLLWLTDAVITTLPRQLKRISFQATSPLKITRAALQQAFPQAEINIPAPSETLEESSCNAIAAIFGSTRDSWFPVKAPSSQHSDSPDTSNEPDEPKELTQELFQKWIAAYKAHQSGNAGYQRLQSSLPSSLTKLELVFLIPSKDSPLWDLTRVQWLSLSTLPLDCIARGNDSALAKTLKHLSLSKSLDTTWFSTVLFNNLTHLTCYLCDTEYGEAMADSVTKLEDMSSMTNLTTLKVNSKLEESNKETLFRSIPTSVTDLETSTILPCFWEKDRKLSSLSLFSITDSRLRTLAPHLTSLTLNSLILEDHVAAFLHLSPSLTTLQNIEIVKAICPSLKVVRTSFSGILVSVPFSRVTASDWNKDTSHQARSKAALEALPRSLTRLISIDWHQSLSHLLPPNLTWLDIRSASGFYVDAPYTPFPDTLTALALSKATYGSNWKADHDPLYDALPRNLSFLLIDDVSYISESCVKRLPQGLKTLVARAAHMGPEIAHLPPTLTSVQISTLRVPTSHLEFPPSVTDMRFFPAPSRNLLWEILDNPH